MATPAVQLGRVSFGGPLVQPGSPGGSGTPVGPTLVSYVDPTKVAVVASDAATSEIDPTQVIVVQ